MTLNVTKTTNKPGKILTFLSVIFLMMSGSLHTSFAMKKNIFELEENSSFDLGELPQSITLRCDLVPIPLKDNGSSVQYVESCDEGSGSYHPLRIYGSSEKHMFTEDKYSSKNYQKKAVQLIYKNAGFYEKNEKKKILLGCKTSKFSLHIPDNLVFEKKFFFFNKDRVYNWVHCREEDGWTLLGYNFHTGPESKKRIPDWGGREIFLESYGGFCAPI